MPLETGTYISDLVASNPAGSDNKSTGDDHMRLIKSTIKATFPNVNGPVTATPAQLNTTAIAGAISMWPTATAPAGFLLCNGAAVSRTTYAALFAIVGSLFGAGDGTTTFNLPNYQDRMPIGAGSAYVANSQGGSKDAILVSHSHTVSASGTTGVQSADHTHGATVNDPGHAHNMVSGGPNSGTGAFADATPRNNINTGAAATGITVSIGGISAGHTHNVTVSGSTNAQGVDATNANLPPYLAIYFIIKT